ncbi:MAG TPA: hypothetical protein VF290_02415 [Pyrinomonadaceae bacterium]
MLIAARRAAAARSVPRNHSHYQALALDGSTKRDRLQDELSHGAIHVGETKTCLVKLLTDVLVCGRDAYNLSLILNLITIKIERDVLQCPALDSLTRIKRQDTGLGKRLVIPGIHFEQVNKLARARAQMVQEKI